MGRSPSTPCSISSQNDAGLDLAGAGTQRSAPSPGADWRGGDESYLVDDRSLRYTFHGANRRLNVSAPAREPERHVEG